MLLLIVKDSGDPLNILVSVSHLERQFVKPTYPGLMERQNLKSTIHSYVDQVRLVLLILTRNIALIKLFSIKQFKRELT